MTVSLKLKDVKAVKKSTPPRMDTLLVSRETISDWKIPAFQRPLRVNAKVRKLADDMVADGGVIPGILTLGVVEGSTQFYLIDGQHRVESAKISPLMEFVCDVRILTFSSMDEMGVEFVDLNSSLVKMKPDDILRGLEGTSPQLQYLRRTCDFVGYNNIRSGRGVLVGMSTVLRNWSMSASECPRTTSKGAATVASEMTQESAQQLSVFLQCCRAAWGTDEQNYRLWSELNMVMTMWLWRELVLNKERGVKRYIVLNPEQFKRCLMTVSSDKDYVDWLVGRGMNERHRAPCFSRLKDLFASRLKQEMTGKVLMPQPSWSN